MIIIIIITIVQNLRGCRRHVKFNFSSKEVVERIAFSEWGFSSTESQIAHYVRLSDWEIAKQLE
jgi:hypothetical protein